MDVSRQTSRQLSADAAVRRDRCVDTALVARARDGDGDAFDDLVRRHQTTLYNVCLRVLRDHDEAVDAVQTTFTKAWTRLDTFDPNRKFFSWLYRIALNTALNTRAKMRPSVPIDDLELCSSAPGPDERMSALERGAAIEGALARLPEQYREVVLLRHFADLSYEEIAAAVGTEAKTVKSRLFTARARLADLLRAHDREASA